ncbi:MAG: tRNA (adenosine(37)-N6)-dimethylallyltransferase MiaA [Gemmatimonadaceae bacterium]
MGGASLRIICGPTAAGKSCVALELAEWYDAAIVSADSRQVYCYFDIGTAKPSREECARVTHYGVDVIEPFDGYSAARWASDAEEWIECAREIDKTPVVVGGTGLYINALMTPLFDSPELDPEQRRELASKLEMKSLSELRLMCEELDPLRAHLGRTQLVRAIETVLLAGVRISDLHAEQLGGTAVDSGFEAQYLIVDPGASLQARIESRIDDMISAGWADEVRHLVERVPPESPAWKASGYRTMRDHIEGKADLSSARERIIIETRQYAKRQRTWFRHQLPETAVTLLNPDDPRAGAIAREWWENAE